MRLSATSISIFLTLVLAPAAMASNDPLYAQQWGPQQLRAPQAWATSTGAGTTIGIVDSGVDLGHPDLSGKLAPGATFLDCGTTSCGNGDWESGPAARQASKSTHGTHVAGIAAATTDNGAGIAGVAPGARVQPVKVLDEEGGSFEDIAAGVRWSVDNGADVINLSLGALPGVQALVITGMITDLQEAIAYARANGVVVVAAAGNDFASICGSPGFDAGALCVASTDKREARSSFSNFGFNPSLDAVSGPGGSLAPICGEDIVSSVPVGTGTSTARAATARTTTRWPAPRWRRRTSPARPRCSPPRAGTTSRLSTCSRRRRASRGPTSAASTTRATATASSTRRRPSPPRNPALAGLSPRG
jgi:subtilisin family serine protease